MKNRFQHFLLPFLIILIPGCAHVISKDLRDNVDPSLTFDQVYQDPNAYKGKFVVWGGEIIQTINQKDGTTQIEVFQRPLGYREEPVLTLPPGGRFLVLVNRFLDPYLYHQGRKITVAGEIQGEDIRSIGGMSYRYPLLSGKQIYLWEDYYYQPYPYYYYYPWWDYPWYPPWGYTWYPWSGYPWYPGRGYPHWGGGSGFHHHNHPPHHR